jgi:hypothetical protein
MIDRKFTIKASNRGSGAKHTEEDSLLFLAKDKALLPMLRAYKRECKRLGAHTEHLDSIEDLIWRVKKWQTANKNLVKTPDTDPITEAFAFQEGFSTEGESME